MAHGTGKYMNRVWEADLLKDEYIVIVYREVRYFDPYMSDSLEPDWEETGKYEIMVIKWRKDRYGHTVTDRFSDCAQTGLIDRQTARMIYRNLRDRNIDFATCEDHFRMLELRPNK